MKHLKKIAALLTVSILLFSCAQGVDVSTCTEESYVYGFWGGLWHGFIAPLDLICMIFSDTITVYAPNNNGGWYALGFCLGSGILSFGASKASK